MIRFPCLFISYDGLLDPLGASQILPYLRGIAQHPRSVFILSFEKKENFSKNLQQLHQELLAQGIIWRPMLFTRRFSYFGKACDFFKMYFISGYIILRHKIKIIHARGHGPAQIGLFWKKKLGCHLLFDFRGLWVDERVDKGGWRQDSFLYRYFKKQEKQLIKEADQIVVLTQAILLELKSLGLENRQKVTVIPCCADYDHFKLLSIEEKKQERYRYLIPEKAFVMGYLGSVGPMYLLSDFFKHFENSCKKYSDTYALILTPDLKLAKKIMLQNLSEAYYDKVKIITAQRKDIPKLIGVMDVMLSFIQPSYARLATSPTKIAESLACGVPVISNKGIGDISRILGDNGLGIILDDLSVFYDFRKKIKNMNSTDLREKSKSIFNLNRAHRSYQDVYQQLQGNNLC